MTETIDDISSLGPEPAGADLIRRVSQVIGYATAGLAAVTAAPTDGWPRG